MRIIRYFDNVKVVVMALKVRKSLGVMSRTRGGHFLILDFDGVKRDKVVNVVDKLKRYCSMVVYYKTNHGYHVITNLRLTKRRFAIKALELGADPVWVGIGLKRGYWFLEVKKMNKEFVQKLKKHGFRFMMIERA